MIYNHGIQSNDPNNDDKLSLARDSLHLVASETRFQSSQGVGPRALAAFAAGSTRRGLAE
eukprot:871990-Pleurochrysis_carterae.AAC.4